LPNPERNRDLSEIFGYAAADVSGVARKYWGLNACPFTGQGCIKHNHDLSIVYGTCSVRTGSEEIIICPNRFYADAYDPLRRIGADVFGANLPFYLFTDYVKNRKKTKRCVVALGQGSGREVKIGRSLSLDWVIAEVKDDALAAYTGVEVQSIDITCNYRDSWHAYQQIAEKPNIRIPESGHGLNWANVHKRLIPQIIRKGIVYSRSKYVHRGLFFVVPDVVYKKFESVLGDLTNVDKTTSETITVHTYDLGPSVAAGRQRKLLPKRTIKFSLNEMSQKFISGPGLPVGDELDAAIKMRLDVR